MLESLCDITLCLSKQGVGTDFLLHKFGNLPAILVYMLHGKDSKFDPFMTLLAIFSCSRGNFEEEEKRHNVIGLSARSKCLVLCEIVDSCGTDSFDTFTRIAERLASEWSTDTVKRYFTVAKKLQAQPLTMDALVQLEFVHGRSSSLDGITALRSLMSLNLDDADAAFIATWL